MRLKSVLFFLIISILVPAHAETVDPNNWRAHMTELARTLAGAFPFIYSRSEFLEDENRKVILESLDRLAKTTHNLPKTTGEVLLGDEPLLVAAQKNIKVDLEKAVELYKNKQFAESQSLIHGSVQKCFACHTSHQIGVSFPAINKEVMGIATPFALEKAVVFGALRQFDGAMEISEKLAFANVTKNPATSLEAAKLHMVVSLRAIQNFKRAQKFIQDLKKKDKANAGVYQSWLADIQTWKNQDAKASLADANQRAGTAGFVAVLMQNYHLHKELYETSGTRREKATLLHDLAKTYEALDVGSLSHFAKLYYAACARVGAKGPAGQECLKKMEKPL